MPFCPRPTYKREIVGRRATHLKEMSNLRWRLVVDLPVMQFDAGRQTGWRAPLRRLLRPQPPCESKGRLAWISAIAEARPGPGRSEKTRIAWERTPWRPRLTPRESRALGCTRARTPKLGTCECTGPGHHDAGYSASDHWCDRQKAWLLRNGRGRHHSS
jgi:hypothetical protein